MISVIAPLYNERDSVQELHMRIQKALQILGNPFEIILVDDGSKDGTFDEIRKLSSVRGFRFVQNQGQTVAFGAGIARAKGEIVVTLDGDLENQPEDIPLLIKKLNEGYDVVAGWRKDRWQKQLLSRKLPSLLANRLVGWITGVTIHDHGCNLRAYRREVFDGVVFRGEMHRMLTAYLGMRGAKFTELPVSYEPRKHGTSKYGLSRTFKVLLDVLALYFFKEYGSKPMHFFGYIGFLSFGVGFLFGLFALFLRLFSGTHLNRTPLPIMVAIFIVVGVQFILMGLLAELLLRSKEETQTYAIKETFEH
jgi:glycosyltransferase involved in cell wall biosynthesis